MQPIDLTRYADRYTVGWDEAATIPDQTQEDRAWLRLIPCKLGKIVPWSETELAAYVFGCKKAKQAERLPFVTLAQGGGPGCDEVIVLFSPDRLENIASFMGARRRRQLSARHRATLVRAGASYRFSGRSGLRDGSQRRDERRERRTS